MNRDGVRLVWDSKSIACPLTPSNVKLKPIASGRGGKSSGNRLIQGDNLKVMGALLESGYEGKFALIYIDPPFLSNLNYVLKTKKGNVPAYKDRWGKAAYLDMLYARIFFMRKLLRDDGVFFVHSDWRIDSHIRLVCDEVFGYKNLLNEIIWHYGGRGAKHTSGQFPRNHDTIYAYGKSRKAAFKKLYVEGKTPVAEALNKGYMLDKDGRVFKTAPRGDYTSKSIERLEREKRIYRTKSGNIRIKYFLEKTGDMVIEKKVVGDVWDDIPDFMHTPHKEKTGYPTQKPQRLLERIIAAATLKGDLVGDFFCGSGTLAAVAGMLGRRWVVCDSSAAAIRTARKRLLETAAGRFVVEKVIRGTQ